MCHLYYVLNSFCFVASKIYSTYISTKYIYSHVIRFRLKSGNRPTLPQCAVLRALSISDCVLVTLNVNDDDNDDESTQ